jgi:hypothetical protein
MVEVTADTETGAKAEATTTAATATEATVDHPRDHIIVAAISPDVEAPAPGAKLNKVTIVGEKKAPVPVKPKYRWDVRYHPDRRQFLSAGQVELTDKPHPVHRRDPTAPSKLKKPMKPIIWTPKKRVQRPRYRYDVTYERRARCCAGREACCIRGVNTKTIPAKVKKAARIVTKKDKKKKDKKKKKAKVAPPKQYRWDVEYERERQQCCSAKSTCCRPPAAMYRADVQYESQGPWLVVGGGERAIVLGGGSQSEQLSVLQRIQGRQRLLHKLLLSHDSPLYDDAQWEPNAQDMHIVQFHEPAAARAVGYGVDGDLTREEFDELQSWMTQLPVVPHLAVVELAAHTISPTEDAALLQIDEAQTNLLPARVLKGFVDVEQEPTTLSQLIAALPPTPAVAHDVEDAENEEEIDL